MKRMECSFVTLILAGIFLCIVLCMVESTILGENKLTIVSNLGTSAPVVPESLALAQGIALSSSSLTEISPKTEINGVTLTIIDKYGKSLDAQLHSISPTQIKFLVPALTATGDVNVITRLNGAITGTGKFRLAPGLFASNKQGTGLAKGYIQRVSNNSELDKSSLESIALFDPIQERWTSIPIELATNNESVYLILYGSGLVTSSPLKEIKATVGGDTVTVTNVAASPYEGIDQINLLLPATLSNRGEVDVNLEIDGERTNTVTIFIQNLLIVSAAKYTSPVAEQSISSAFSLGVNILDPGMGAEIANTIPLPVVLRNVVLKFRGAGQSIEKDAQLLFVSNQQINFIVPSGLSQGPATVFLTRNGVTIASGKVQIDHVAPGIFTQDFSGKGLVVGSVLRVRANGSQMIEPIAVFDETSGKSIAVPVDLTTTTDKVYLIMYGTGLRGRSTLSSTIATIGGENIPVLYAGPQGTFEGLDQLNLLLPLSLRGRGVVDIILKIDSKESNKVTVSIR